MQKNQSQKKKIPDTNKLVKKSDYSAKVSELVNKIPSISGLVTTFALTEVENKIPSISNLVKKTDYDKKLSELEKKLTDHKHDQYITTPELNKLTQKNLIAKIKHLLQIKKTFTC